MNESQFFCNSNELKLYFCENLNLPIENFCLIFWILENRSFILRQIARSDWKKIWWNENFSNKIDHKMFKSMNFHYDEIIKFINLIKMIVIKCI